MHQKRQSPDLGSDHRCSACLTLERCQAKCLLNAWVNKQIGGKLGISEITVKAHRGKVMRKMNADSLADLVKMDARLRPALAPKG